MSRYFMILAGLILLGGAFFGLRTLEPAKAQPPSPPCKPIIENNVQNTSGTERPDAAIKKITEEYVKAFNAKNTKAAAALWTEEGEFIGVDGETVRGRAAIEKSFADEFKAHPKATIEVQVESVRPMGRQTALAEGVVKLKMPGDVEVSESRYSALHVLEDGKWQVATVREWQSDPGLGATMKFLDWLAGQWTAKGEAGNIAISYTWDENKTFLIGKYSISKDGKTLSSGTQMIGRNPSGGLRSWMFDSTGTINNGYWEQEGNRWVDEASGTLPDGIEISSVNVLIPLGKDCFTWQTTEHYASGVALPPLPPIKVNRIKTDK